MMASDPAMSRYFAMTAMRIGASMLMVIGIVLLAGNAHWLDRQSEQIVGVLLVVIGMLDLILVLPWMARRWRSGPPPT